MDSLPKYEGTEPQWYVDAAGQWYRIGEPDPRPMIVKLYEQKLKEIKMRTLEELKADIELYKEAYAEDARPRRITWLEDIIKDLLAYIECQSQ